MNIKSEFMGKEIPVVFWKFRVGSQGHPLCAMLRSLNPVADTEHGFIYFVVSAASGKVISEQLIPEYANEQFRNFN